MKRGTMMRRLVAVLIVLVGATTAIALQPDSYSREPAATTQDTNASGEAATALEALIVKGRAPKTGYSRDQFGSGWGSVMGCDTRNDILRRDLTDTILNSECQVVSGALSDPYTGKTILFQRGSTSSQLVQIDHVVALSDAWQKGAQQLSFQERQQLANDPLELLAVDGAANQEKGDGDAATWLPPSKLFRCQYVARQIAVKQKYRLWVTAAEKDALGNVLAACPDQPLPVK